MCTCTCCDSEHTADLGEASTLPVYGVEEGKGTGTGRWRGTYISHILREQVLESLTDRVALGHDALPTVVACAG